MTILLQVKYYAPNIPPEIEPITMDQLSTSSQKIWAGRNKSNNLEIIPFTTFTFSFCGFLFEYYSFQLEYYSLIIYFVKTFQLNTKTGEFHFDKLFM